jgi:hypothetical protein
MHEQVIDDRWVETKASWAVYRDVPVRKVALRLDVQIVASAVDEMIRRSSKYQPGVHG